MIGEGERRVGERPWGLLERFKYVQVSLDSLEPPAAQERRERSGQAVSPHRGLHQCRIAPTHPLAIHRPDGE